MGMKTNARPGDIYLNQHMCLHRVMFTCQEPTATVQYLFNGARTGAAILSPTMEQFTSIGDLDMDELRQALVQAAIDMEALHSEKVVLEARLADEKLSHADTKIRLADLIEENSRGV